MIQANAANTELSNDHVMRLGEDRLALQEQLRQLASATNFGKNRYQFLMDLGESVSACDEGGVEFMSLFALSCAQKGWRQQV